MEVRQRRERGCRVFLSCENQIFLKLPQQWLAEKAATAMTGQGHVCTHNLIHHRAPDTISINLSSACPPKKEKKTIFLFNHLWLNQAYSPLTNGEDQNPPAGWETFSHEHKHKVEHMHSCLFSCANTQNGGNTQKSKSFPLLPHEVQWTCGKDFYIYKLNYK